MAGSGQSGSGGRAGSVVRTRWRAPVVALGGLALGAAVVLPVQRAAAASSSGFPTVASASVPDATSVAVDPVAGRVYLPADTGVVQVLDEKTLGVITEISVPDNADSVVVDPADSRAYVGYGTSTSSSITVIDTSTETVIGSVPTGDAPGGMAVDPSANRLYVANYFSNTLSVIDTSDDQVITTVPTDAYPSSVVVNDTTDQIFVGEQSGNMLVLNRSTLARLADFPLSSTPGASGAGEMAIDPGTDRLYVPNDMSGDQAALLTVDGSGYRVIATTPTGPYPSAAAFDANHDWVYVASQESPTLSVIDAQTAATIGSQPVPAAMSLADDPALGRLFVLSRPYDPNTSSYSWTLYEYDTANASPNPATQPTTTTLSSTSNPSVWGQPVTFTAAVSPADTGGSVDFLLDDAYPISGCQFVSLVPAGSGAQATCTTSALSVGSHFIQAYYSGDGSYAPSNSSIFVQTVEKVPTTLTAQPAVASTSPAAVNALTLTARLTDSQTGAGIPYEPVAMASGSTPLCQATTDSSGAASCSASGNAASVLLAQGYTATFVGDADYQSSSGSAGLVGAPPSGSTAPSAYRCSLTGSITPTPFQADEYPGSYKWSIVFQGTCTSDGKTFSALGTGSDPYEGPTDGSMGLCDTVGHVVGDFPDFTVGLRLTDPDSGQVIVYDQWWALDSAPALTGSQPTGVPGETVAALTVSNETYAAPDSGMTAAPGGDIEGAGSFATRIFGNCPGSGRDSSAMSVSMLFSPPAS